MSSARLFFTSSDTNPANGNASYNLWVTDGTNAGTRKLPVAGGVSGIDPTSYAALNGAVYFDGADTAGKFNLFRLDGSTGAVSEILVGNTSSTGLNPTDTVVWNGRLYFQGRDAANNYSLWSSDGTAAGTGKITIPNLGGNYYPTALTPFGDKLAFATSTGIYLTDGTSVGTSQIPTGALSFFGNVNSMAKVGTKLLLSGPTNSGKNALFVADNSGGGIQVLQVPGLNPSGDYAGRVTGLTTFGDKAGFTAVDAAGNVVFWVTDGTVAGTIELPGLTGYQYGSQMTALAGNKLAFIARDPYGAQWVYVTDGTAAGTARVTITGTSTNGLYPSQIFAVGNQLYFDGMTNSGARGLFASNGAASAAPVAAGVTPYAGYGGAWAAALGGTVAYTDTTAHTSGAVRADIYTGPVSYLQQQYIWSSADGVAMAADAPGTFLHGGMGDDALSVAAGSNVLDGGTGSNFLTGAAGTDGGTDTFFVDGRGGGVTWSTINNFHHGDAVTVFGFVGGTSTGFDVAGGKGAFSLDGAQGYQGATIHSELGGSGTGVNGSLTIAGMSAADAASKLTLSTGTVGGTGYLYIAYTGQ